jgi:hypothetical protein
LPALRYLKHLLNQNHTYYQIVNAYRGRLADTKLFYAKFVTTSVNHQNIKDMLIIEINSDGRSALTFNELEKHNIPAPPNGFDSEIDNNIIMRFDDEQQAIDYSYELDGYAITIDNKSAEYSIITKIIKAISDDDFVRTYIQSE